MIDRRTVEKPRGATLIRLQWVDRTTLSKVPNGRAGIRPMMALRVEWWLGVERCGSAERWLSQQLAYDPWQARDEAKRGRVMSKVRAAG